MIVLVEILVLLVGVAVAISLLRHWRQAWTGPLDTAETGIAQRWYGDHAARLSARTSPVSAVVWCDAVALYVLDIATHDRQGLLYVLRAATAVVAVVGMAFVVMIGLVNRPRWAVPPSLRGDPGLLAVLANRIAARRSRG